MNKLFTAVQESVNGPKRRSLRRNRMSGVGGIAAAPHAVDVRGRISEQAFDRVGVLLLSLGGQRLFIACGGAARRVIDA